MRRAIPLVGVLVLVSLPLVAVHPGASFVADESTAAPSTTTTSTTIDSEAIRLAMTAESEGLRQLSVEIDAHQKRQIKPRAARNHVKPPPTTASTALAPAPPEEAEGGDWLSAEASWYGPCCYGNHTACDPPIGERYTEQTMGVAHRTLPCGTVVTFTHKDRTVTTRVNDRGPFTRGRTWDLSRALCAALDHCFTGQISYRIGS